MIEDIARATNARRGVAGKKILQAWPIPKERGTSASQQGWGVEAGPEWGGGEKKATARWNRNTGKMLDTVKLALLEALRGRWFLAESKEEKGRGGGSRCDRYGLSVGKKRFFLRADNAKARRTFGGREGRMGK